MQGTHIFIIYFYHFLWVAVSQFCYLGWSCLAPLSSTGILLSFLMVGELQLNQMSFNPLPSLPMNPLVEVTCRESSPGCLVSGAQQAWFAISIVCFTLHPILKVLYSQIKICKQTLRSTHASQMLVGPVPVSNPKFWYLQGS